MRLSIAATKELKEILRRDLGEGVFRTLDDEAIQDLGIRLLRLTASAIKQDRKN